MLQTVDTKDKKLSAHVPEICLLKYEIHKRMSLVAHPFGRIELRIFVVFFRQALLKKSKQIHDTLNSTHPN